MLEQKAGSGTDHFPWDLLIPIGPQFVGLLLLALAFLLLGRDRIVAALKRVKKFAFFGVEVELVTDVEVLVENRNGKVSRREARSTVDMLEDAAPLLSCSRILWVDDNPENNIGEMVILRRFCVHIDIARSTREARDALNRGIYDILVSDMTRGGDESAGTELVPLLEECPLPPRLIYYVGIPRPPGAAFGSTTQPDELFRLIVRALQQGAEARPSKAKTK